MSDIAVRAEKLSKRYRIGQREPYRTLRDVLTNTVTSPFRRRNEQNPSASQVASGDPKSDHFWALKDVSFEIKRGDVVGIIGGNGAGKSTLLKILSRTTDPTEGCADIYGRVGSLLEIGTGFHPELTGRENIYLNAAILGMKRKEIDRKFDEIVTFSEIEKFLDMPVKHYSSGMYVRLAFAVAAHLEPEILLVDEVLAVGDAQFQKKCLGKMRDVAKGGRTVLFVSHQMTSIAQLCNQALLIDKGKVVQTGAVQDVINHYYMNMFTSGVIGYKADGASQSKDIAIIRARSYDAEGNPSANFTHNQEIVVMIACKVNHWSSGAEVRLAVRDTKRKVFTTDTELRTQNGSIPEEFRASVVIPAGLLRPGQYFFTLATYLPNQVIFDLVEDAFSITVIDGGSKYAASEGLDYGCVFVDCKWSVDSTSSCY